MRVIGWFWFARREASALDQSPGFAMGGVRLCQARLLGCTVRAERFARPKHRVGVVEGSRRGGKRTIALCPACHRILRSEPQLWLEMIGSKARRDLVRSAEEQTTQPTAPDNPRGQAQE